MLLKQTEAATYAEVPGIPAERVAAIWQRIENWIAYRWPARSVVWTVEGGGFFCPPLAQWSITSIERAGQSWEPFDAEVTVLGVDLPEGVYRIAADVGAADAPAAVQEAFRRLAAYLTDVECMPAGVTRVSESVGQLTSSMSRSATYAAQALRLSGAADLLRPWRHA